MNRFGLLSLYRSLTRHRLYAALNVGGLAVGIAVFLVLGLYVRFETSFEHWLPHHDDVYLVQTEVHAPGPFGGPQPATMGGLIDQLHEDFPGLVATRLRRSGFGVLHDGGLTREDLVQVDPSFFDVFDLPMTRGDGRRALEDPANVLISQSIARKYFGAADPVGQTMTIMFDEPEPRRVAGVFRDLPKNSELKIAMLMRMPDLRKAEGWYYWGRIDVATYVRFSTPALARAFAQRLPAFVDRRGEHDLGPHASKTMSLLLQPIAQTHLEPSGLALQSSSLKQTVATLGVVGVLTLLIAIVNYVNLATARAELRAREVAMRKVLGADRRALIVQFLGEAVATSAVAVLVGLALAELGLPFVNAAGGLSLTIPYLLVAPAAALLALAVGVSAGLYPALLISRFSATAVLASARAPGGGRKGAVVRDLLVILQFGLAIAFVIGAFVLVAQTRHVRRTDLGFRREGLLIVPINDRLIAPAQAREVVSRLQTLPGVSAVGVANQMAGGGGFEMAGHLALPGVPGDGPVLRRIDVGPDFFTAYGVRPVAGRLFDDRHGEDDVSGKIPAGVPVSIVISHSAVPVLGFRSAQDAIGKTVGGAHPRTVIGVVPELKFFSPRRPNDATVYDYQPDLPPGPVASVRFAGDPRAMIAAAREVWLQTVPQSPFSAELADKRLEKLYEDDERATRLFSIGAVLAVAIGCIGLWGLASFNTSRRVKEIGIRKTLGASSADIVRLLIGQFLRPVLIANLIAWPLAYLAISKWLAGFYDRIALTPLYFVAGTLLALVIAVLTVAAQSFHAARATPAWALRHE